MVAQDTRRPQLESVLSRACDYNHGLIELCTTPSLRAHSNRLIRGVLEQLKRFEFHISIKQYPIAINDRSANENARVVIQKY